VIKLTIGFFDSGFGGITVLYEALRLLPGEEYIYYADTINAPYGVKPKNEVKQYILEAIEFLVKQEVKAVVVACNTATSIAIEELRSKYNIPIIGMEPAVKPAVEISSMRNKRVLVTATPLTIKEEKLKNLIDKLDNESIVDLLALPKLVEFAEALEFREHIVLPYLKEELSKYNMEQYGTIVLGCTHFPYYRDMFKKLAPENIDIIDGSLGTINNLRRIIDINKEKDASSQTARETIYYISGSRINEPDKLKVFQELLKRMEFINE
jgi:glutamate racemase